jgi:hypothetical protein
MAKPREICVASTLSLAPLSTPCSARRSRVLLSSEHLELVSLRPIAVYPDAC